MTAVCTCALDARQWNGYGTCLSCGGAYEATGDLAPIVLSETLIREARRIRRNANAQRRYQAAKHARRCVSSGCAEPALPDSVHCDGHRDDHCESSLASYHRRKGCS